MKTIKHQAKCNDCKKKFFLEDAPWCKHKSKLGIGTKACPNCGNCICHGETAVQIQARFDRNIRIGKFEKVDTPILGTDWTHQCVTIKEVEVNG